MSAEAHTSLGVFKAWFEHDWEGSERELRRAIALNPSYAYAHDQLNQMLGLIGRFDEAIAEGQRAIALDPLSPSILTDLVTTSGVRRQDGAGAGAGAESGGARPDLLLPRDRGRDAGLQSGNFREAIPKFERARTLDAPPFVTAYLAYAYGMSGDRTRAMATLEELRKMSPGARSRRSTWRWCISASAIARRALDYLEQAYAASSEFLVWLKVDRIYDPLRSEPRFVALMKRLNFPE